MPQSDVGNIVLRDRKLLSQDGILVVVLTLEQTGWQNCFRSGHHFPRICVRTGI